LCGSIVENRGHHYGWSLPHSAKDDLIYFLRYQ
jgi:hypothetical protein